MRLTIFVEKGKNAKEDKGVKAEIKDSQHRKTFYNLHRKVGICKSETVCALRPSLLSRRRGVLSVCIRSVIMFLHPSELCTLPWVVDMRNWWKDSPSPVTCLLHKFEYGTSLTHGDKSNIKPQHLFSSLIFTKWKRDGEIALWGSLWDGISLLKSKQTTSKTNERSQTPEIGNMVQL